MRKRKKETCTKIPMARVSEQEEQKEEEEVGREILA